MRSLIPTLLKIVAIIVLASSSHASNSFEFTSDNECTEKRLDKAPGSVSKIPVQDQDGTNLCSSYTAAQLIDAWQVVNNPPIDDYTSPLALGIEYASLINSNKLRDFSPISILNKNDVLKSCSYSVVKDQFNSKDSGQFIYELAKNFVDAKSNPTQKAAAAQTIYNCVLQSGMKTNLNIEKITHYMNEEHWVKFTSKIFAEACKGNQKSLAALPKVNFLSSRNYKNQFVAMNNYKNLLHQKLNDKNAMPVGISYCRKVLDDRNTIGVTEKGHLTDETCKNNVHASTIVGRRLLKYKNGNKVETICQFLVRNSFGSSCSNYPQFEEGGLPLTSGERPRVCEDGQVWVDENALLRNTAEIYHY